MLFWFVVFGIVVVFGFGVVVMLNVIVFGVGSFVWVYLDVLVCGDVSDVLIILGVWFVVGLVGFDDFLLKDGMFVGLYDIWQISDE